MKEKHMQSMFGKYLQQHPPGASEIYELKIVKGPSIPFDAVKPHQVDALVRCSTSKGLYHKLTDLPISWIAGTTRMRYSAPSPFDCMYLCRVRAYVVLWFYVPRTPKEFLKIDIFDWQRMKGILQRKSLPRDKAYEIAKEVIKI